MPNKSFSLNINHKIKPFVKSIKVDSDKSQSIRSFLIGSISQNISITRNVLESEDVFSTIDCLKKLGVQIKKVKPQKYRIHGKGLGSLFAKKNLELNFGNSGTLARLLIGILSVLEATLTLPGIAGIILTVGMAVDANVLIFERIREEVLLGRTPISAIDAGYKRALTTIIDSNLTTLFAAICLYSFGSGPIKGFAVTLAIGILTSMFTSIMLTRFLIVLWLRGKRPNSVPI